MAVETPLDIVMLVDDNTTDIFIARRITELTRFAKKVIVTSSCSQALEYLFQYQKGKEVFTEIIFRDINMPLCDGFYFLDQFKELNDLISFHCKVILSSSDHQRDIERILSDGHVINYITKRISEARLEEIHFKKIEMK